MTMKLDRQHASLWILATLGGLLLVGIFGLSIAHGAPADQPVSNAPAKEQPVSKNAPPADSGTKAISGPPNPFDENPAAAPATPSDQGAAGRSSTAQPTPPQGPSGTSPATQPAKPEAQGRSARPNPFETESAAEGQAGKPSATTPGTPDKSAAAPAPSTEKPAPSATEKSSESAADQSKSQSTEQPSEETYTPAQQAVRAGIALIQKEKYDDAIGHFDEALKIDPTEGAAFFYKGVALRMLNRLDDAIEAFTASIALTTDDLDAQAENYLRRGIVWFYKGEYGIAWQDFDDATMFAKAEDPRPDFWKGLAFARQSRWLDASNAYADAIEHDDHFGPAFVNLGLTYLALDEPKKAVFCFDQAIRLDSHNANNYFKRGVAQARVDKLKEAVDSYTQAIRLNPDYAEAYFNRSVINHRLGDEEQASKDRAAAIKINPDIEKQLTGTG
jgi:tetratricopeptide (TPR) repeat protein